MNDEYEYIRKHIRAVNKLERINEAHKREAYKQDLQKFKEVRKELKREASNE
jgi:hypothetical protein